MRSNESENVPTSPPGLWMEYHQFNDHIEPLRCENLCSSQQSEVPEHSEASRASLALHTSPAFPLNESILDDYYIDDLFLTFHGLDAPHDSRSSGHLISGEGFATNDMRKETLHLPEGHSADTTYSVANLPKDFQLHPDIGPSSNVNTTCASGIVLEADIHHNPLLDPDSPSVRPTSLPSSWEIIQRPTSTSKPSRRDVPTSAEEDGVEKEHEVPPTLGTVKHTAPKCKNTRRKFKQHERQKMNLVRRNRACIRCQWLKEDCGEGHPCPRCQGSLAIAKIWRMPCFKGRITDAELHRTGALSFPSGIRKVTTFASNRKLSINLYNAGFVSGSQPVSMRPAFKIVLQEFLPLESDPLSKKWNHGDKIVELKLPAFAIAKGQQSATERSLDDLLKVHQSLLLQELGHSQDKVAALTLEEAIRHHQKWEMVHGALALCVITRLASKSFNITGDETLGIPKVEDPQSPYYNRKPIPPLLDAQIDRIWIAKMSKVKKKVLSELKKRVFATREKKRENWYPIFLTIFVLTWNLEFLFQNQNRQLERYCEKNPQQSYPPKVVSMMEGWKHSAENLRAHFHSMCQGQLPFLEDWDVEETQRAAGIDILAVNYLKQMKLIISERCHPPTRGVSPSNPSPAWTSALFLHNG